METEVQQNGGPKMATAKGRRVGEAKGRILFIDDDRDTCEMMDYLFNKEGYEIVSTSCMAEGLRLAKVESFNLILLDWYFPDGTGIEMCQMIRTFDQEIPIFFYTGVAYESELKKALNAGAQGWFVKPVDMNNLMQTVSSYLCNKDGQQNGSDCREQ